MAQIQIEFLFCCQVLGVVDISDGFPDAALGLAVAIAGIEAHAVQVVDPTVVAALQRLSLRPDPAKAVKVIGLAAVVGGSSPVRARIRASVARLAAH
jgi:hypothetical protein